MFFSQFFIDFAELILFSGYIRKKTGKQPTKPIKRQTYRQKYILNQNKPVMTSSTRLTFLAIWIIIDC